MVSSLNGLDVVVGAHRSFRGLDLLGAETVGVSANQQMIDKALAEESARQQANRSKNSGLTALKMVGAVVLLVGVPVLSIMFWRRAWGRKTIFSKPSSKYTGSRIHKTLR